MTWIDALGWGGSVLLVYSILQSRVLRLRILNFGASAILVAFNALIEVWPMVAMNVALCLINLWFIVRFLRERHDESAFGVLQVAPDDTYLQHVLAVHAADIARHQPGLAWDPTTPGQHAFVVTKGDETVGVVLLRLEGTTARVQLDWVTPRFRDLSPGEFVWRRSGLLRDLGIHTVVTPPGMVGAYYARLGFQRDGDSYVLTV